MLDLSTPERGIPLRVVVGTTMIIVAMLGLIHLFAGNPGEWADRIAAGGAVGAWTGGLLAAGFSSYVAVPLLLLVIVYGALDRKSTRLNSSHVASSYAVLCLQKKNDRTVRRSGARP